ncbi:MAG: universal stress protein, partial [Parvularcula sp.]|nr:universal stress protein [Parvularcula sp.]
GAPAALREALIRHAVELAERSGTDEIVLFHAWSVVGQHLLDHPRSGLSEAAVRDYVGGWEAEHRRWLNETVDNANRIHGKDIRFTGELVRGEPHAVIPEFVSARGGLLVIGSANRAGVAGLLIGNTAEGVIDRIEGDVYVVKPEGFEKVIAPFFAV